MKNAVNLKSFPLLIIAALFVAFVIHPELRLSDLHAAVPFSSTGPTIKSEAQVKSEAAHYDDAILQIKQIANLKLAVPEESKKAQGILDKQIPNLRFNRSKLIAFGLNDPGFVGAAKAKAGDKKSAEQFALELGKDHNSILKLPGAQSVSSSIRSSIEADTALLRRIAQLLKDAAVEIKAKSGHVMSRPTSSMPGSKHMSAARVAANPVVITDTLSPEVTTLLVVAAAVVICPPLGVAIFELANVAGVVLFTAAYI